VFQPRNPSKKRNVVYDYERVAYDNSNSVNDVGMYREFDVHKEYQRHMESILGPLKRPLVITLPQNNVTNIQTKQNKTINKNTEKYNEKITKIQL
jgi:hypothetical protein